MPVDVQMISHFPKIPEEQDITLWALAALAGKPGELCVRVVDEPEVQQLNAQFRNIDKPTNVLSFPTDEPINAELCSPLLGDVVVCAPVVAKEAREQKKTLQAHFAHMVVHGVLHLLGFDHENDKQASCMESKEQEILAEQGFSNPYQTL